MLRFAAMPGFLLAVGKSGDGYLHLTAGPGIIAIGLLMNPDVRVVRLWESTCHQLVSPVEREHYSRLERLD
jgi:hypothetical protein